MSVLNLDRPRPPARPALRVPAWAARAALAAALLAAWQLAVASGAAASAGVPAPLECLRRLPEVLGGARFWSDAARSLLTTAEAFAAAALAGLAGGAVLARFPLVAKILEPYLVGAYAVPVVVFYPTFLVVFGLGTVPIVLTAFLMAVVPVLLTTMVALGELRPAHRKLARSLCCTRGQAARLILLPSALPLLLPGLKLGFVYAMAATVGAEFIVADAGLGFRIGELYRNFEAVDMYVHIIVMIAFAVGCNSLFNLVERIVRRDLT
ncbi:NitT/TauT family transport system permease protein [Thermocatellispora tengchongensis]|uniref:NitT/TauT family transport system permease protein n=1 Tax=Thermocatellispora tengchongensis TaxID=1073253 RepID=A0A840PGB5_9ACTN|nr:ABC transporter permease subunit [Thermocatellispora tengchongensis]MBB5137846.1 NitT/TauT family transport system permease protein [Thermocatellispora tengchongensis]